MADYFPLLLILHSLLQTAFGCWFMEINISFYMSPLGAFLMGFSGKCISEFHFDWIDISWKTHFSSDYLKQKIWFYRFLEGNVDFSSSECAIEFFKFSGAKEFLSDENSSWQTFKNFQIFATKRFNSSFKK